MPYTHSITAAGDVGDISKFTSPLKLFDYLSVGKVILCSDFKVLREILKDKKNELFIKNFTNAYSWKMEIEKLINQKIKIIIMSKNNFSYSKKFNHIKRAKQIINEVALVK